MGRFKKIRQRFQRTILTFSSQSGLPPSEKNGGRLSRGTTAEPVNAAASDAAASNAAASIAAADIESGAPQTSRVDLAEHVTLQRRQAGGYSAGLLSDEGTGKHYHVGPVETFVLEQIADGGRDLTALVALLSTAEVDWSSEDLAGFIETLGKAGLLRVALQRPMPETGDAPTSAKPAKRGGFAAMIGSVSWLISFRIPIANFDRPAATACSVVGGLLHPVTIVIACVWIAVMLSLVAIEYSAMMSQVTQLFDRGLWLPMLVVWVVAKAWHELGHAVAAKRLGVRIGNIGVTFFMFTPLAYVDVTDAWRLERRRDRIMIALAGVYFELIVASFAAAIWWCAGEGFISHFAAQVFLVSGPATLLVNANPLLRLDGYYALSDLLDIPNLRSHGRGQLIGIVDRAISGAAIPPMLLSGWRRSFATMHAMASLVFQIIWMSGLVFAAAYMFGGLGVIIAAAAVGLWVLLPATRYIVVRMIRAENWSDRFRLVTAIATIGFFGHLILSSTSPLARRVPVIVDDASPQIARASAAGFVSSVFVTSSQSVTSGELLMRLRNDDLRVRRNVTADELRLMVHTASAKRMEGELAESKAATEQAQYLKDQLAKLDSQIADLEVVANRDGIVTTPNMDRWLGQYVQAGDVLLTISDPAEKELIVSVDDSSVTAYEMALNRRRAVPVRFRGGRSVTVIPVSLRPSSSKRLPDPAFSAAAGGPIPVEADGEGGMQSVVVRTESHCELSPIASLQLYKGQIGSMRIGDDRTIAARLWHWANEGLE